MVEESASGPIADTTAGRVRGISRPGSHAFLGIPFAAAPVGENRFAAPVPPPRWEGIRDARSLGPTPQRGDPGETLIPEPSIPGDDTLTLNVYTPSAGSGPYPVLVWIHGGGYVAGSPASPWYDGRAFTRDGVVQVVISYRLGFDGFGWIDGAPANRGVRDWIAALEWVQQNIDAFGGDPQRVTIAGQSAGGGAVLTLVGMPAAQHLFHGAIAMSPAAGDISAERAGAIAQRLATRLGVAADRAGFASVPAERILAEQAAAGRDPSLRGLEALRGALVRALAYGPVLDGELVERPVREALASTGTDKPLLIGSADDEFGFITQARRRTLAIVPPRLALGALGLDRATRGAYRRANREVRGTPAVIGRFVTDRIFRTLVPDAADARESVHAAPTWVSRFAWPSPVSGLAIHCLDVPFFFDCLDDEQVPRLTGARPPQELADQVHGSAVQFIRTGTASWAPWSPAGTTRIYDAGDRLPSVLEDGYRSVAALR